MQFFPDLPDSITLEELNVKWNHYVDEVYHARKHGSTGEPPITRYLHDIHLLRGAPTKLPDYFRNQEERTVGKDRSIRLENRIFQAPIGFAGKRVTLRYESLDRVELFFEQKSYGFIPLLDQHVNSRIGRQEEQAAAPMNQSGNLFSGGRS